MTCLAHLFSEYPSFTAAVDSNMQNTISRQDLGKDKCGWFYPFLTNEVGRHAYPRLQGIMDNYPEIGTRGRATQSK